MFTRRVLAPVVAIAVAALMLLASMASPARAAPQPAQPQVTRLVAAVTETTKVTLPETSIAGPGFAAASGIAWTGTDPAHHLNLRIGTDGLHFPTKATLAETSPFGPGLNFGPGDQPLSQVLAWTGTDPNHSLNVAFVSGGSTTLTDKVTLHETSIGRPAISFGCVGADCANFLAWTGTDPNHSLNILPIMSLNPLRLGQKVVLSQFSSDAGPSLAGNVTGANEFVLGWSVRGAQQLNLATSTDGVHFNRVGLPETSAFAPQFSQTDGSSSGCIAWTGTDATNHLNVQCTTTFPTFPNPKTILPETAFGAPGLSFFNAMEIAWTGTDPAHHLNVAQLGLS